jgi:PAS domain S-box-containing protein
MIVTKVMNILSKKILLVEDDLLIAFSQKNLLEKYGYLVTSVTNGEEAVNFCKSQIKMIDLILIDIELGKGMNGIQAAEQILKISDIPLIFLSSHTEKEIVQQTEHVTNYGYVVKDSGITVLDASIKMALKLYTANQKLIKTKDKLEATLKALPDLLFVVGLDGLIFEYNSPLSELLYKNPNEFIGKTIFSILPTEVSEIVMSGIYEANEYGFSFGKRYQLSVPAGILWFEISISRMKNSEDVAPRFVVIARDITMRKQAEQALETSRQQLALFIEHAPVPIAMFDREMRYLQVSGSWCKEYKITEAEIYGLSHYEIFPDLSDKWKSIYLRALAGEIIKNSADRFEHKDGSVQWLQWEIRPWFESGGQVGGIFIFSVDITEKLKESEESKENEAKFTAIFNHILNSVVIINADGIIQTANHSTIGMFGFELSELIGQNINILMPIPYKSKHDSYLSNYKSTGIKKIIGIGRELFGQKKNGEIFPIELTVSEWKHNGETFFTGMVEDITTKKAIEERMHQSQKLEALGQISGGIAHDFNNILAILMGYLELLARKLPKDNSSLLKYIDLCLKAVDRGSQLTRKLLAFARKQEISPIALDINVIVRDSVEMLEKVLGKEIEIKVEPWESPLNIFVDESELENVILNMAINARDAMDGYGVISLSIRKAENVKFVEEELVPDAQNSYAELSISDTGKGIPPEILGKIFEPFFTTKVKNKGTGLGLSLTYGFMQQSKGNITVYSELGKGTCFKLYFPIADSKSSESNANIDPPEVTMNFKAKDKNILLVDDELSMLNIGNSILSDLGYNVSTAENASDAIIIMNKMAIDLVITDVIMPGEMNGIGLATYITESYPKTKIILSSGFPGHLHKEESNVMKEFTSIEKPFRIKELESIVLEMLND